MTSVHSINFPQAQLMAGGYFGLSQASQNALQIKQRQLTIKHMILPMALLTFSQQKWPRREKLTPSLGNESYISGGSKKGNELGNNHSRSLLHWYYFTGQEYVLGKLLRDWYEPSLYSLWNHGGVRSMLFGITMSKGCCAKSDLKKLLVMGTGVIPSCADESRTWDGCIQHWTGKTK